MANGGHYAFCNPGWHRPRTIIVCLNNPLSIFRIRLDEFSPNTLLFFSLFSSSLFCLPSTFVSRIQSGLGAFEINFVI